MTDTAIVGDVIGQGTAGAALVSQLNLDHGMNDYFGGSSDEIYYGSVRCEYVAYQDDVGKPSAGVRQAQTANIKMSSLFCSSRQNWLYCVWVKGIQGENFRRT